MGSIPDIVNDVERLETIEGQVPSIYDMPKGCRFSPRCVHATEICRLKEPAITELDGRKVRCFLHGDACEEA